MDRTFSLEPKSLAKEVHLRYISDQIPGINRISHGRGFIYLHPNGEIVKDPQVLERIMHLAIPPAWSKVWISPVEEGHLQATGLDEKGRKQYLYHERWREIASQHKFDKLLFFAKALPEIRKKVALDMETRSLNQQRVVATVIWLLEHTYIRVGNEEYEKENQHFGLTTLRSKHIDLSSSEVTFTFVGKSGKEHRVEVIHPRVVRTIKRLEELPGYHLFQYLDEKGEKRELHSEEVNQYLKELTGEDITAKDFRTWGGTKLAATSLHLQGTFETQKEAKLKINQAVKHVAKLLGNTPTMAKNYYIHPVVPQSYQKKILIPHFEKVRLGRVKRPRELSLDEVALIELLEEYS